MACYVDPDQTATIGAVRFWSALVAIPSDLHVMVGIFLLDGKLVSL